MNFIKRIHKWAEHISKWESIKSGKLVIPGVFIYLAKGNEEYLYTRTKVLGSNLSVGTGKRFTSLSGLSEDTYTYVFYGQPVYKQLVLE